MAYKVNWTRDVDVIENDFTGASDYILNLPKGFRFTHDGLLPNHVRGYDSRRELLSDIKNITSCNCQECKGNK